MSGMWCKTSCNAASAAQLCKLQPVVLAVGAFMTLPSVDTRRPATTSAASAGSGGVSAATAAAGAAMAAGLAEAERRRHAENEARRKAKDAADRAKFASDRVRETADAELEHGRHLHAETHRASGWWPVQANLHMVMCCVHLSGVPSSSVPLGSRFRAATSRHSNA